MTTKTSITTIHDQNLEKQMGGCMAGFFNHLLSGKRHYPKRLPPPVVDDSEKSKSKSLQQKTEQQSLVPDKGISATVVKPVSPWKFAPRLSLDSRAITDEKGGLRPRDIRINTASNSVEDDERRSPSVIARLMGLEPISSSPGSEYEPVKKVELRRSASESRSRDYYCFDGATSGFINESVRERRVDYSAVNRQQNNNVIKSNNNTKPRNNNTNSNNRNQRRLMLEKRSYYDTTDFFPAEVFTKHQTQPVTIYGEIERRLRARGIDEPRKDLETLKHILEAMQLKGLLHSQKSRQNVVYDRREESPIVLMKSASSPTNLRRNNNVSTCEVSVSPRKERPARSAVRPPGRAENRSSSPTLRRKGGPLSVETTTTRSSRSPVQSPRLTRPSDQTVNRSPRRRRPKVEICHGDEASTVSESSFSASSHTDNERWRVEEHRDGRNLLERCDKLLNSIAEITASSTSNSNSSELQQPSPVSVLDSSFYKEDESSPSPVKKRTINFKDEAVIELEEELWSPTSSTQLLMLDNDTNLSDDIEFNYVSEVIRALNYFPDDKNLFLLIEKQTSIRGGISRDYSKASILRRKLIFDTISEILDCNRHIPPWKVVSITERRPMLDQIWSEFQNIRQWDPSEDLFEVVCGVLKKDMARDSTTGWDDCPVEMSEAILDIERLIFKDLIGETIRDLAVFSGKSVGVHALCRKLVF